MIINRTNEPNLNLNRYSTIYLFLFNTINDSVISPHRACRLETKIIAKSVMSELEYAQPNYNWAELRVNLLSNYTHEINLI